MENNHLRKFFVKGSIAAALFTVALNVQAASESATVNITATVVDNTCTPGWTGATEVNMNRVSLNDFGDNKEGATKPFTLNLTNCGSGTTKVKVTASGLADSTDNTLFANTLTDSATGVGVSLMAGPAQATQLEPSGSNSVEYTVSGGAVSMPFLAKLMKSGTAAVKAGNVKSIVTLTVDYE